MRKRIYSLNMAAYIIMATGIQPELSVDYEDGNGLVHMVFPETKEVSDAMTKYTKDTNLHQFLQAYNTLRENIKEVREDGNG